MNRFRSSLLSIGTASLTLLLVCAPSVQARAPHSGSSTVTRTGPNGNSTDQTRTINVGAGSPTP